MINIRLPLALSLILCIGFSGCGSNPPKAQKLLDESAVTKKVHELGRNKLEHGKAVKYVISGESDVSNFETGRSHTVLFELPEFKDSSTVEIKSYCDCFGFAKDVFIPIGVLLDEGFNKVGEIEFATHSPTMMEPVHFISETPLEKSDRYVLIYSDPNRYGKPADSVYANVTHVSKERMDYIRKGTVKETYTDSKQGVWWKGAAVGEIQAMVKSPQ
ncbi:MAG: hypothetical protein HZB47_00185 [Nitrosomonadales bacterium]|nr:hypothetical protein [Nitrosomonadales bacterium]